MFICFLFFEKTCCTFVVVMKKIAIYHPKGGSGRSTLTIAIADYLKYVLKREVQVVETDVQRTILNSVEVGFQDRHIPVAASRASAQYVLYDGAPYTKERTPLWLKKMDLIIMPVVVSPNDATSVAQTLQEIPKEVEKKVFVVFNRVVKPHRKSYKGVKPLLLDTLKEKNIKVCQTEISQLDAFALIGGTKETTLSKKTNSGKKALEQMKSLFQEIKLS